MGNTNNKANNENKKHESMNAGLYKMPKNIRQIGTIGSRNKVIYVEDYVMTFIKQLSEKDYSDCRVAVLLGYYIKTEESNSLFIKGAIEMKNTEFSNDNPFSDEAWTIIYETIKKYFNDVEIVGWSLIGPEFLIENGDRIRKIHLDNFNGPEKVLLKVNNSEKEESFYFCENKQLVKQTGFYIYYEKNEDMQNYMVENKEVISEEKSYEDKTTQKIRTIIKEKKETKDDKSVIHLLYAACSLLVVIVLVTAAVMIKNNEQMKSALNQIYESINNGKDSTNQVAEEDQSLEADQNSDSSQSVDKNAAAVSNQSTEVSQTNDSQTASTNTNDDKSTTDKEEAMEVETISGNIVKNTAEDSNTTEDSGDNTKDTEKEQDASDTSKQDSDNSDKATTKETVDKKDTSTVKDDSADSDKSSDESTQTSKEVRYYIVEAGDSLAGISYKLYNSANYVNKIQELNGIEDENKIYEGQKLIVP